MKITVVVQSRFDHLSDLRLRGCCIHCNKILSANMDVAITPVGDRRRHCEHELCF